MRAIWSFWAKPYLEHRSATWASEKHHLLAWGLSLASARRHYPETHLYTDTPGARLLVEQLGLEFSHVSTALDDLSDADPGWWALGKLYAGRLQDAPFVHLDSDVFLWKPLPAHVAEAPVLAQNPEPFRAGASYYHPDRLEAALRRAGGGWLPEEWRWYRANNQPQRAECCGIFGGSHVEFLRHYADTAIKLVEHSANRRGLAAFHSKIGNMVLIDQYCLSACLEYHRAHPTSPYRDVRIAYLFRSAAEAFDPERAQQLGYTHLIAGAKRNPLYAQRLEARVRRDLPGYSECCEHVSQR